MDIKLNFINQSNAVNNSSVVIFGKNVASDYEPAVAWKVIEKCGRSDNHPFVYPQTWQISASDGSGSLMPRLDAKRGECFEMVEDASGKSLQRAREPASWAKCIEVKNALQKGSCEGLIYKDGRLYGQTTLVAPGQRAVFEFKPTIWIGAASQVREGESMNWAILSEIDTEITLLGIASADIVMTDGAGPKGGPLKFTLQNIVMA